MPDQKQKRRLIRVVSFKLVFQFYAGSTFSIRRMTITTLPLISNGSFFFTKIGFMVGLAGWRRYLSFSLKKYFSVASLLFGNQTATISPLRASDAGLKTTISPSLIIASIMDSPLTSRAKSLSPFSLEGRRLRAISTALASLSFI